MCWVKIRSTMRLAQPRSACRCLGRYSQSATLQPHRQGNRLLTVHAVHPRQQQQQVPGTACPQTALAAIIAAVAACSVHAAALVPAALAEQALLPSPLGVPDTSIPAVAASCGQACSERLQRLTELSAQLPPLPQDFPPLPDLQPPAMQMVSLPNGLQVYLLEDHEVPLIKGSLLMAGGQTASPADQVGVASISAAVQRAGGSQDHPWQQMDAMLDDLTAYVEVSAGQQATQLVFECESADLAAVLGLASEVIRQPLLPQEKLDLVKAQVDNLLEHRDDSSAGVAQRELRKLVYGGDSMYARTPARSVVAALQRADVAAWLAAWQRPDSALLGLVGDFQPGEVIPLLEQTLGAWQPGEGQPQQPLPRPRQDLPPQPPATADNGARLVHLVDRPGAQQASITLGEPGVSLSDPDVFSLDVLSTRLNGFGGLLFDSLRSRSGLAYSVGATWDSPPDHTGLLVLASETSQPARFLQELEGVLAGVRVSPPTSEELGEAKAEALNSWVFNFASRPAQLQRVLAYKLLGVPQDFLFQYKAAVEAVTPEDVLAAAQRHLHPQQQTVVVVGDAATIRPQLEAAGFAVQPLLLPQD